MGSDEGSFHDEEPVDGDDLLECQERDYRQIPTLDVYERDGLDEQAYSDMDPEDRRAAEQQMLRREQQELAQKERIPGALLDLGESEGDYYD